MKNIWLFLCFTLLFWSCKNEPEVSPTAVLDGMISAMKDGNIEAMKNHFTKSDIAMLDAAEKIMTGIDPDGIKDLKQRVIEEFKNTAKNIQVTIKHEKIDGDQATVEAEITNTGNLPDTVQKTITQKFELVKEDNVWKIALSKPGNEMFNSMKGNRGARKADLKDGVNRLQKMDPDSLKMLIGKAKQTLDSLAVRKKAP